MEEFRVIEIKQRVFEQNRAEADLLRDRLFSEKTLLLNLMGSPGAGKTSLLLKTIESLKKELRLAVIEADIDSDVDARAVSNTGTNVVQLHTGGMCHIDADMTRQGLESLNAEGVDLVILENVGNLVCPAEFDTGAHINVMILSVPEGDDKPLKYPLMFRVSDVLIISKIDTLNVFNFDKSACIERALQLNPAIKIFPVSVKTGEGLDSWIDWLRSIVSSVKC